MKRFLSLVNPLVKFLAFILGISSFYAYGLSSLEVFDKAASIVSSDFYNQDKLKVVGWERLVIEARSRLSATSNTNDLSGITNQLLAHLQASHTRFLSYADQEFWILRAIFAGEIDAFPISHIGAIFQEINGKWLVRNVLEESIAQKVGLLPKDEIVSASGAPFEPVLSFQDTNKTLDLFVQRDGIIEPLRVMVTPQKESFQRSFLKASRASFRYIDSKGKKFAYFHLWAGTHPDFNNALDEAAKDAAQKSDFFILDLRDGVGGAYPPETLKSFMSEQAVYNKPMAALINRGTRSGKEWVAYVLKESGRATLVGSKTQGAVLPGRLYSLEPEKYDLFLAVKPAADSPEIPPLEGIGVTPHVEVDTLYSPNCDPVLTVAINVLATQ